MKQAKHTPGPWGCVDTSNHAHDYRLTQANGHPLPLKVEANDHSEQRANARLIAAAPDLLAVVRTTASIGFHTLPNNEVCTCSRCELVMEARAAIAKATNI